MPVVEAKPFGFFEADGVSEGACDGLGRADRGDKPAWRTTGGDGKVSQAPRVTLRRGRA